MTDAELATLVTVVTGLGTGFWKLAQWSVNRIVAACDRMTAALLENAKHSESARDKLEEVHAFVRSLTPPMGVRAPTNPSTPRGDP